MGDMADAWISEGFATYAELLFMEEKFGYPAYLNACSKTMQEIMNIWPMVGARDVNDNTFLGGDIYNKGAIMLNNLRCIINNDSQFFWLIRDFYEQYKFKIATTDDFIRLAKEVTGNDYTGFFNKFLYSTEPPVLAYEYSLFNKKLKFSYQWINVDTNFSMPFTITLNDTLNFRLTGSTGKRIFKAEDVNSFYLPNEYRLNKDRLPRNAFTYYWTSWKR